MEQLASVKCFGGKQLRLRHRSSALDCEMSFSLFLPPRAEYTQVPLLTWLSGLTCTDENFVIKAGAQRYAVKQGIALLSPDTSPRGEGVPGDPEGGWDFGLGAGFYVDAAAEPWRRHYRMYEYVTAELPQLVFENFPLDRNRHAISGHSMGGHGALTIALTQPGRYRSVSAFAPICAPAQCPWGQKAFRHFFGDDRAAWDAHDATRLIASATERLPLLIEQGGADIYLEEQLKPELLREAAAAADYPITMNMRPGYDHGYLFVASFIGEHLAFHAQHLSA
jgi:S-formylglutathione hydrolase